MVTVAELPAGFADKVLSAQSTFRSVMDAMARPGSVQRICAVAGAPGPMMRGTAAIALTLFDHDTPVWLDAAVSSTPDVAKWLKFHTSAPVVTDPSTSSFAVIGDTQHMPPLDRFALGSSEYPDRSTTLILQVDSLSAGPACELTGPGINGTAVLQATCPGSLFEQLAANATHFPRGIDVVLVHDDAIVAIPRTTRLAAYGA
ncbi:phosphonate C-P lyase system protein PhnH [Bradyrhizobium archetypum]|uniref:Phosphonate C-P lyase system protein PhnH n=1 Tax=Bradyrhizobium archetypum TaxID=2721160 RepID=A0A7Y4H9R4_9BRAD|nr:phosphonate C-P lyase system protein PhnH [Bradyrhizobium archetypum]NOJ49924.1 phosphonate C-P lyase system protein PhnH [Bradyrhizobium archetypum]